VAAVFPEGDIIPEFIVTFSELYHFDASQTPCLHTLNRDLWMFRAEISSFNNVIKNNQKIGPPRAPDSLARRPFRIPLRPSALKTDPPVFTQAVVQPSLAV
jgi:hypothetical protein